MQDLTPFLSQDLTPFLSADQASLETWAERVLDAETLEEIFAEG